LGASHKKHKLSLRRGSNRRGCVKFIGKEGNLRAHLGAIPPLNASGRGIVMDAVIYIGRKLQLEAAAQTHQHLGGSAGRKAPGLSNWRADVGF